MITEIITISVSGLVLYRLWFSPLAFLPGPKICALTRLVLMYHEFTYNRRKYLHTLHLKYGPIVRIAPDEVSFATWEAVKEIYVTGGSGYEKSSFYHLFLVNDTPNIFSALEKGEHAELKRRFAERYSKAHIMKPDVSSVLQEQVDVFLQNVSDTLGSTQDIYELLHCFALDSATAHLFYPAGLHSQTDADDLKIMHELSYHDSLKRAYTRHYFPKLWRIYSKIFGISGRREGLVMPYIVKTTCDASVAEHTVLARLRSAPVPRVMTHCPVPEGDEYWKVAASECMDDLVAGIDTTGDALCFLMHHLSLPTPSSQRIQTRLHAEIAAHPGANIDDLPYLDAVVKEGLRVFCPAAMSFPRVVPKGGRTIDGVALPEGTIVSCQPYTLHRLDEGVFPNPEEYVPERWLEPEGETERNQLFFAFATGGRGCIGKHLALLEMKLLLRDVYSTYRTHVAPEMDASMEQDDQVISTRPKDQKCLIIFEKIKDAA